MIHYKSNSELEKLRASADLVGRTLAEVATRVAPGVSTNTLDKIAETFIRDHGASPAFKGYRVGHLVFPGSLCTSVNDTVVHGIPNDKLLTEGDIVTLDCGVLLDGFYGDSAYTFAVGEISDDKRALCSTTYESLYAGIDQCVPGRRLGDIGFAVQSLCEARGYGVVKDLVGHGIGRSLHEDPQVPNFGRAGNGRKLKAGLVICIEPMINMGDAAVSTDADGWTIRTIDNQPSAHYEHMVAVTDGGPEVLTTFQYIEDVLTTLPYEPCTDAAVR
ncbi:MAG: type I methionyl aminopeptidase [Rhodothermales bacterium]